MPKYFAYVYEEPELSTPYAYITCPVRHEAQGRIKDIVSPEIKSTQEVDEAINFLIGDLEKIRMTLKNKFK